MADTQAWRHSDRVDLFVQSRSGIGGVAAEGEGSSDARLVAPAGERRPWVASPVAEEGESRICDVPTLPETGRMLRTFAARYRVRSDTGMQKDRGVGGNRRELRLLR